MDTSVLQENWKELKDKIRPHWKALSDQDIAIVNGHVDSLIDVLRERYGYTPQQAQIEVEHFLNDNGLAIPTHQG